MSSRARSKVAIALFVLGCGRVHDGCTRSALDDDQRDASGGEDEEPTDPSGTDPQGSANPDEKGGQPNPDETRSGPSDQSSAPSAGQSSNQAETSSMETRSESMGSAPAGSSTSDPGEASSSSESTTQEGTSATTEEPGTTTSDPKVNACQNAGFRCVAPAPRGWQGPLRLSEAGSEDGLERCASPNRALERLYSGIRGNAAVCRGCEVELDTPSCTPPKFEYYADSSCPSSALERTEALSSNCQRVPDLFSETSSPGGKFVLPKPARSARCQVTVDPNARIPKPVADQLYRGCNAIKPIKCLDPAERCVEAKSARVCVYRNGRHSCPFGSAFRQRTIVDADVEDTRSCGSCTPRLNNWKPKCKGSISFYAADDDSCSDFAQTESFEKLEGADECFTTSALGFAGWYHMKVERPQLSHNASCSVQGWGPRGSVRSKNPVTFCCQ